MANPKLDKKVKAFLDSYLKGTDKNSAEYQHAIMLILRGALTDANFHSEARQLDKFFPKAKSSKYVGTDMETVIEDKGIDIANAAKWDGYEIIDAFVAYTKNNKLDSLKEAFYSDFVSEFLKEVTHSHEYEDMSMMGEDSGEEIIVDGYQTKYFHVCPGATNLYKDIESKNVDMDIAKRSVMLQDALFFVEKHIQRDGYKPERDYVMVAKNLAKNIMRMAEMMGLEEEHQYIQGHVDTISNAVKEKGLEERVMKLTEENVPTDPSKWSYYKSQAKKKFDVYPSAYANAWAAKQYKAAGGGWRKSESVNEGDVTKKINRRGDEDGLLVKHNGEEYHIVYSGDFDMGSAVQPYGIVMPGDDTVSFLGKDKKAKQIWKQLKPKVDKFFKTNEATPEEEDEFHRNLDKLVHKTFGHSSDEEKMNEANEPDIISQLRDIVSKKQNQKLKDPKSGKTMRVDLYSASAVTQVYDALKQQSNKDKFVSMGLVGMVNMAFKLINKQEIVEYDVETLEELNDFHQFMKEYKSDINEAEYQGRKVELGKIMQGDVKKFKVYVKNDKGNVVKVNFGQGGDAKGGTMRIRKNNPEARKSFRARHNCDNPGPRWKARYWSCRKW